MAGPRTNLCLDQVELFPTFPWNTPRDLYQLKEEIILIILQ
jgi:hypothetical protein